jgi:adhesin transport system membrane fusion protein
MSTPVLHNLRKYREQLASFEFKRDGAWLIYTLFGFIVCSIIWAAWFEIDEITRGMGKIIPSTEVKLVQHLEGGVVRKINVRIGDAVKAGDALIVLDPRRQQASLADAQSELSAINSEIFRHEALLKGTALNVPQGLVREADLAAQRRAYETEKGRFAAEMSAIDAEIGRVQSELVGVEHNHRTAKNDVKLAQENLAIARRLSVSGALSDYERIREEREALQATKEQQRLEARTAELNQQIHQARARKNGITQQFQAERWTRLSELYAKRDGITARENAAEDGVDRSTVRSPVNGIVKNVFVNAEGAVAQPGAPLVEVVPGEDDLLVEAHIRPQDIGFIVTGQNAVIKVTAYDFAIYGALVGKVEHISADTIRNKEEEFYVVRVRIKNGYRKARLDLKSGMTINVDIITGRKSVLLFISKPITRGLQEALTER